MVEQSAFSYIQLVNDKNPVVLSVPPMELVTAPFSNGQELLEKETAQQLQALVSFIKAEKKLIVTSGYRSRDEQQQLYNQCLAARGQEYTNQYVARPGRSEHQTGLAVDIGLANQKNDSICPTFEGGETVSLFLESCGAFGFILRYPPHRQDQTGIAYEPWHFRYVGCPHSQIIQQQDWVLEDYHEFLSKWRSAYG
ncbi:D-alanyl-D-alanine carboxypeptidase family protein [Enterococcus sp. LJL128]